MDLGSGGFGFMGVKKKENVKMREMVVLRRKNSEK